MQNHAELCRATQSHATAAYRKPLYLNKQDDLRVTSGMQSGEDAGIYVGDGAALPRAETHCAKDDL
jgi:hypothetical protein